MILSNKQSRQSLESLRVFELANLVRTRQRSCLEVVNYFLSLAYTAHIQTNCVTQFLDASAKHDAQIIDKELENGKEFDREKYPMLGVPISIKDSIDVKDGLTTCGFKKLMTNSANKDASIVKALKNKGCIVICKTNVCQFLITPESSNPVFGLTTNPHNPMFISGGSSSGEGALISLRGSTFGIGSDIAGSIRYPASFCSLYSMKPTSERLGVEGHYNILPGLLMPKGCMGPITNKMEDLDLIYRALWSDDSELMVGDYIIPICYREIKLKPKLKFGYYTKLFNCPCSPANERAILETTNRLKNNGHEVIEIDLPSTEELFLSGIALLSGNKMKTSVSLLSSEGIDPTVQTIYHRFFWPNWIKTIISLYYKFTGELLKAKYISATKSLDIHQLLVHQAQVKDSVSQINLCYDALKLDCILSPVFLIPCFQPGQYQKCLLGLGFCYIYNLLDYPTGVLPITRVDRDKDHVEYNRWIRDKSTADKEDKGLIKGLAMTNIVFECYEANEMHGLPVSIQLSCKQYQDEKLLAIMSLIDEYKI